MSGEAIFVNIIFGIMLICFIGVMVTEFYGFQTLKKEVGYLRDTQRGLYEDICRLRRNVSRMPELIKLSTKYASIKKYDTKVGYHITSQGVISVHFYKKEKPTESMSGDELELKIKEATKKKPRRKK